MTKHLLATLNGQKTSRPSFWFMRQAGRYLPEYRELRSKARSFLDFCYTPEMAAEATLQPIRRFGMDGAIIFSDILVVPHALGVDVRFEEGRGPVVATLSEMQELDRLALRVETLQPVYEALRMTKAQLPEDTTLIGFAGAPWTLACYMIEGGGSRDFQKARQTALRQPEFFARLIELLTDAVTTHAIAQIKAGAEVIQLFDSWAGVLSESQFVRWAIEPAAAIVRGIKNAYPHVPVIGFPRQAGSKYLDYAKRVNVDALSIDHSVSLGWAKKELQHACVIQGNLDPVALAEDKKAMLQQAKEIIFALGDKSFVFNLGHGILPHTPVEHMQTLCRFLKDSAIE